MSRPYYRIAAEAYLTRAEQRLSEPSSESLFYAAFELRCGIEQRMREYLEVRTDISKKRKQGWQIAKLGADLDRVFRTGDQIAEITMHHEGMDEPVVLRYVPVRQELRRMAERLGGLLHAAKEFHPPDDRWWNSTDAYLRAVASELRTAVSGSLLGPPLLNRNTGEMLIHAALSGDDHQRALSTFAQIGARATLNVRYIRFGSA